MKILEKLNLEDTTFELAFKNFPIFFPDILRALNLKFLLPSRKGRPKLERGPTTVVWPS